MSMWWEGASGDVGDAGFESSWFGDDWASCSKRPTRLETRFLGVSVRAMVDVLLIEEAVSSKTSERDGNVHIYWNKA